MTITTDDKITVGLCDFLSGASDTTLQTWVYKYRTREDGTMAARDACYFTLFGDQNMVTSDCCYLLLLDDQTMLT